MMAAVVAYILYLPYRPRAFGRAVYNGTVNAVLQPSINPSTQVTEFSAPEAFMWISLQTRSPDPWSTPNPAIRSSAKDQAS